MEYPFDRVGPEDFKRKLENGELSDSLIIDVREPYEWEYYRWDELVLMPMNSIPERLGELPKDKPSMSCAPMAYEVPMSAII